MVMRAVFMVQRRIVGVSKLFDTTMRPILTLGKLFSSISLINPSKVIILTLSTRTKILRIPLADILRLSPKPTLRAHRLRLVVISVTRSPREIILVLLVIIRSGHPSLSLSSIHVRLGRSTTVSCSSCWQSSGRVTSGGDTQDALDNKQDHAEHAAEDAAKASIITTRSSKPSSPRSWFS